MCITKAETLLRNMQIMINMFYSDKTNITEIKVMEKLITYVQLIYYH